jgi:hypothetical protein
MTHKEIVCAIEPDACLQRDADGVFTVCRYPKGPLIGISKHEVQAWQSARMKLLHENVAALLSEIPVTQK